MLNPKLILFEKISILKISLFLCFNTSSEIEMQSPTCNKFSSGCPYVYENTFKVLIKIIKGPLKGFQKRRFFLLKLNFKKYFTAM